MTEKLNTLCQPFNSLWFKYSTYVNSFNKEMPQKKNITYWRDQLFINLIRYALPICVVSVVPIIIIEWFNGQLLMAATDLTIIFSVSIILLNRYPRLKFKKLFTAVMIIASSILKTAISGMFEIGGVFLISLSVFIALSFSRRLASLSVLANLIICVAFAFSIGFKLMDTHFLVRYTLEMWVITSINFLFINLSLVILVLYLISGLEETISKVETGATAIQVQNEKLKDIAFMHSHVVRAPLAKIIGLVTLFNMDTQDKSNQEILVYLDEATKELDLVINNIVGQANTP